MFGVVTAMLTPFAVNEIRPDVIEKILKRTKNILCNNGDFSVVVGTDRLFLAAFSIMPWKGKGFLPPA